MTNHSLDVETIAVADGERARLRQALHDSVCQSLNALQIFMALHARSLSSNPEAAVADGARLKAELQQASMELNDIVAALTPPAFGPTELTDEIAALCQRISRRLPCNFSRATEAVFSSAHTHAIYEICREGLLFFVEMETAQQIDLTLATAPNEVTLNLRVQTLSPVPASPPQDSWAYRILAARIATAGGQLKLAPVENNDLLFSCALPFPSE